ncbi:MAG: flavin reductase family protein [Candidatus Bipolaricaulaceae bacterium]
MRPISPWENLDQLHRQLSGKGAFLLSARPDRRTNVMTIGWGMVGTVWSRPVFLALVRPSRYTHDCIQAAGAFSVSVPLGDMEEELAFCGSRSGREVDKVDVLGLELTPPRRGGVALLAPCELHYECRVVARASLAPQGLVSDELQARHYPSGDLHTLFFGEVVAAWRRA